MRWNRTNLRHQTHPFAMTEPWRHTAQQPESGLYRTSVLESQLVSTNFNVWCLLQSDNYANFGLKFLKSYNNLIFIDNKYLLKGEIHSVNFWMCYY
jgi:hypothetical protein